MLKAPYLRVSSPVTSDGVSPVVVNDRIKYREDLLPLTAKKMMEKKNERLPTGLRKKIEVVNDVVQPAHVAAKTVKSTKVEFPDTLNEDDVTDDELQEGEKVAPVKVGKPAPPVTTEQPVQQPAKKKGGRPKRNANG